MRAPSVSPEASLLSEDPVIARRQSFFSGKMGKVLKGTVQLGLMAGLALAAEAGNQVTGGIVGTAFDYGRGALGGLLGTGS